MNYKIFTCCLCLLEKSITDFFVKKDGHLHSRKCKTCLSKAWRESVFADFNSRLRIYSDLFCRGEVSCSEILKDELETVCSSDGQVVFRVNNNGKTASTSIKIPRHGPRGYVCVDLYAGKIVPVHRIVCSAWNGPPPKDKTIVNHIDCNKQNNNCTNLEWCDHKHNNRHARIFYGTNKTVYR